MSFQYRLVTFYPLPVLNYGIGHAALSLVDAMSSDTLDVQLISPSSVGSVRSINHKNALPTLFSRILYKFNLSSLLHSFSETYFLRQLQHNDIAYLWPGASLDLYRRVKAKGNIIVTENINCHQKISKRIMDHESEKLNLTAEPSITAEAIADESEKLKLSDFVFSPSPLVTQSLIDSGISQDKIIGSSYGLHKHQQLTPIAEQSKQNKPITAIFVGRVGMRKGIHLLLEYWKSANIDGVLQIIGNIEDPIQDLVAPYQKENNIQFIEFLPDIETAYRNADIFILPSLEEGSPLVTYLALGAGLPCLVSPMAGEGVITNGQEGFIIDPHDKDGWITALQKLFGSASLRKSQSTAARQKSDLFIWENVGYQRADLLLQKLQGK